MATWSQLHDSSEDWLARFTGQAADPPKVKTGDILPTENVPVKNSGPLSLEEIGALVNRNRSDNSTTPPTNVSAQAKRRGLGKEVAIGALVLAAAIGLKLWKDSRPPVSMVFDKVVQHASPEFLPSTLPAGTEVIPTIPDPIRNPFASADGEQGGMIGTPIPGRDMLTDPAIGRFLTQSGRELNISPISGSIRQKPMSVADPQVLTEEILNRAAMDDYLRSRYQGLPHVDDASGRIDVNAR